MARKDIHKALEYSVGYSASRAEASEWSNEHIRDNLGKYLDAQCSINLETATRACGIVDGLTSMLMERGVMSGLSFPGFSLED